MRPFTRSELRWMIHQSAAHEKQKVREFQEKGAQLGLHPLYIKGIVSGIRWEGREQRKRIREVAVMKALMA